MGKNVRRMFGPEACPRDPWRGPLRHGRGQEANTRVYRGEQPQRLHAGQNTLFRGTAGSGQDEHSQVDSARPPPRVLSVQRGRHDGRGRDQGTSTHLHRRHAWQGHTMLEEDQDRESAHTHRRDWQAGTRWLPRRPQLCPTRAARPRTEL